MTIRPARNIEQGGFSTDRAARRYELSTVDAQRGRERTPRLDVLMMTRQNVLYQGLEELTDPRCRIEKHCCAIINAPMVKADGIRDKRD